MKTIFLYINQLTVERCIKKSLNPIYNSFCISWNYIPDKNPAFLEIFSYQFFKFVLIEIFFEIIHNNITKINHRYVRYG